jgi:hypothetical protein
MKEASDLHRSAMDFAERAALARISGDDEHSRELLQEAFERESAAASLVADNLDLEPSRSVLHRSAASLALELGDTREAERIIAVALTGTPSEEIADELRDLLEEVYFRRHLNVRGITLQPNELLMSLSGPAVGFGIAESDQLITRLKDFESLVYRTAERVLKYPFRERGRIRSSIVKSFQLYLSAPVAGSFSIAVRIGSSTQLELPGMETTSGIIDELLDSLELFNGARVDELRSRIPEDPYYRNFVGLARKIAPDGDDIRAVGLTSLTPRRERKLSLTIRKERAGQFRLPKKAAPSEEYVKVRGTLRYADHLKEKEGEIRLVDSEGRSHRIRVPSGMMSDIVRPLWEYEVVVEGYRRESVIHLEDIDRAED